MSHDVFISYAHEDKAIVESLANALEAQSIQCWYSQRDVGIGADYEVAILKAISVCQVVVLILSRHSNDSSHVRREIQNACADDVARPVLPVRIDQTPLQMALRYYLGSAQWLDASSAPIDSHLHQMVTLVRTRLKRVTTSHYIPTTHAVSEMSEQTAEVKVADGGAQRGYQVAKIDEVRHHVEFGSDVAEHVTSQNRSELRDRAKAVSKALLARPIIRTILLCLASIALFLFAILVIANSVRYLYQDDVLLMLLSMIGFLVLEAIGSFVYFARSKELRWKGYVLIVLSLTIALAASWGFYLTSHLLSR